MTKLALLTLAVTAALPAAWSAREKAAARRITANGLAAHVRFLADDLLEGRAPASRGSDLAMRYVATEYERIGLEPAGDDGGWLQKFDIVGVTPTPVQPLTFSAGGKTLVLKPGTESVLAAGSQTESMAVKDADVIFVGYGITAPEQKWDDYRDVDVRGKVVM